MRHVTHTGMTGMGQGFDLSLESVPYFFRGVHFSLYVVSDRDHVASVAAISSLCMQLHMSSLCMQLHMSSLCMQLHEHVHARTCYRRISLRS